MRHVNTNCGADEWISIAPVSEIPVREGRNVRLEDGTEVALFNLGDERFLAVENRCPHGNGPLADGILSSAGGSVTVTCPLHSWRICLESGSVAKPSGQRGCVATFPVTIEGGIVRLQLPVRAVQEAAA